MPSETLNIGFRRHLFTVELSPSGGEVFQRQCDVYLRVNYTVLIPMWWGGFSETKAKAMKDQKEVLIPMWWGGFSEKL